MLTVNIAKECPLINAVKTLHVTFMSKDEWEKGSVMQNEKEG
jgi:hypothetical protein